MIGKVGWFEYNCKMIIGTTLCRWFGHPRKKLGRCCRCLRLWTSVLEEQAQAMNTVECEEKIREHAWAIEEHRQDIRDIAKARIEDFHWLEYEVSTFWDCEKSPVGMCVFKLDDMCRKTYCRYCGGPTERK